MKEKYYVNTKPQSNGDHEVHVASCQYLPKSENRIYLGEFASCREAVREAGKYLKQVNGCIHCCTPCHTQ